MKKMWIFRNLCNNIIKCCQQISKVLMWCYCIDLDLDLDIIDGPCDPSHAQRN